MHPFHKIKLKQRNFVYLCISKEIKHEIYIYIAQIILMVVNGKILEPVEFILT